MAGHYQHTALLFTNNPAHPPYHEDVALQLLSSNPRSENILALIRKPVICQLLSNIIYFVSCKSRPVRKPARIDRRFTWTAFSEPTHIQ